MGQLPLRINNHILETKSKKHFESCVPDEWVVNEFRTDYGTDLDVEIAKNNEVTGLRFSVQLKSKIAERNTEFVNVDGVKRSTINRWLNRLEPTLITCYVLDNEETYWIWFDEKTVDLTAKNKKFRIKLPTSNKLSLMDWNDLIYNLQQMHGRKHLLFEMPKLDFGKLSEAENIAWSFYLSQDYSKASFFFNELLQDISTAELWNALSSCQYQMFYYQDALESVNRALSLRKELDESILNNKACILTEYGLSKNDKLRVLEGKKIFQKTIKPDDRYNNHFNYANALSFLEEFPQAEIEYKKTLKKNPKYAEAWKNLGSLYHKMNKYDEEIECYDKALEIDPYLAEALMSKGTTLFKVYNKPNEALALMLSSFEVSNDFNKAFLSGYFWISQVYQSLGDYKRASQWTSKGLEIDPGDDYLLNQQAYIFCKTWKENLVEIERIKSFFETYLLSRKNIPNRYPIIHELAQIRLYQKDSFSTIWTDCITPNSEFFEGVELKDLSSIWKDEKELLASIKSVGGYQEFRSISSIEKYHLIILERTPLHSDSKKVIQLINIAFMHSFGLLFTSFDRATQTSSFDLEKDILEPIFDFLSYTLPKIARIIYDNVDITHQLDVKHQCCLLMPHISTIEIRLQLEHIVSSFSLDPAPMIESFTGGSVGKIWFQYLYMRSELEISK